ncbi:PIG-L family deacetylase [Aeromonas veronii]|uniref:PIG-L family deacetylase n=1 Tax=Aeromonas veronii TaxID=654 RepID=UPI001F1D8EA0|nr:PIG-L family deacetylase [Aeromonas veronii]MCF5869640.1 PIG-L family deacetylase [Aeromonas veronii]
MNIYLLAHQDDEFFCLPYIRKQIQYNEEVLVVFLTNGCFGGVTSEKRNRESLKTLIDLGVDTKNVMFFGESLEIDDGKLHRSVGKVIAKLENEFATAKINKVIFPCFEGGHQDHDSISYIVAHSRVFDRAKRLQFSLYNAYKISKPLFRVYKIINDQNLSDEGFAYKISDLRYILNYKSQKKSFIGLGPFIIVRLLFNKYINLVKFENFYIYKRPHLGALLYEKRTKLTYEGLDMEIRSNLEKN